jgi:hypothetical protein
MAEEKPQNPVSTLLGLGVIGFVAWYFFAGGLQNGVAKDFEKQYQMALSSGSPIDVCVRAGLVAEGYLQAQDQDNYRKWKAVEKQDCKAAGIEK